MAIMQKHQQSGRSMIEMLGVIAIIGILSAGGITGYSVAMEAYKINKTIKMVTDSTALVAMLFTKRNDGTTFDSINNANTLCQLGAVSSDICSRGTGQYRKGFFGENIGITVFHAQSRVRTTLTVTISEGDIKLYSPSTAIAFYFYTGIPAQACAKIVSSKVWEKTGEISTVGELGSDDKRFELPLAITDAVTKCKEEENKKSGYWRIMIYTSVAGFTI